MNKFKNKFVPCTLAIKLKEIGFDENCIASWLNRGYSTIGREFLYIDERFANGQDQIYDGKQILCLAPLWEEAFDWFRDKYNLDSYVSKITYREWKLEINYIPQNDSEEEWNKSKRFIYFKDNQKDARITCLEKLIEIVKKY